MWNYTITIVGALVDTCYLIYNQDEISYGDQDTCPHQLTGNKCSSAVSYKPRGCVGLSSFSSLIQPTWTAKDTQLQRQSEERGDRESAPNLTNEQREEMYFRAVIVSP